MTTATATPASAGTRSTTPLLSPAVVTMSALLAIVAATTSAIGLLSEWAYAAETENWRLQARGQDLGNVIAVVVLALCVPAARRGSFRALSLWAGACLYLAYAFTIYAMSLHFGPLFPAYVAGLGLSVFCLLFTFPSLRGVAFAERRVHLAATVLTVIAVSFALLWLTSIGSALARGEVPPELVEAGLVANPVHVLDLALVLPAMVVTALRSRRGDRRAQALLAPWLVFSSLMAASIAAAVGLMAGPAILLLGFLAVAVGSAGVTLAVLRGLQDGGR